jgi:hypothetical protein
MLGVERRYPQSVPARDTLLCNYSVERQLIGAHPFWDGRNHALPEQSVLASQIKTHLNCQFQNDPSEAELAHPSAGWIRMTCLICNVFFSWFRAYLSGLLGEAKECCQ